MKTIITAAFFFVVFFSLSCNQTKKPGTPEFVRDVTNKINDESLVNADKTPSDWLSNGGNYSEDRYSALTQISKENIQRLGLVWSLNLGTTRGIEATPIIVNGIMYISGPWSIVYSIDARTGKQLWVYDPKVSGWYGNGPDWKYNKPYGYGSGTGWNTAIDYDPSKPLHDDSSAPKPVPQERLIAWDPVEQREKWRLPLIGVWNGGVVTTAAGLVFEGTADGKFMAVDAITGKPLWQTNIGSGIIAPPVSYGVDGKQYITIAAGWGGAMGLSSKFTDQINPGTIYTFALDSNKAMPAFTKAEEKHLINMPFTSTKEELQHGALLYTQYCMACHSGVADNDYGVIPDLGYSSEATHKILKNIVLKGLLESKGMPNFSNRLSEKNVTEIQSYILATAKQMAGEKKKKLVVKK